MLIYLMLLTARAQDYASEVLYPDDLIPVEDLEGTFLVEIFNFLTFNSDQNLATPMPIPPATTTTTTTTTTDDVEDGPGKNIFIIRIKTCLVKYGTLTCADGFIRLDIYSKDVMLAVCFAIFILQGNNIFV